MVWSKGAVKTDKFVYCECHFIAILHVCKKAKTRTSMALRMYFCFL